MTEYASLVNGTAFYYDSGNDLSAYQTGEYRLLLTDASGKIAYGIISPVAPAGETLGSEKLTNTEFTTNLTGWVATNNAVLTRRDFTSSPDIDPTGGADDFGLEVKYVDKDNPFAAQTEIAGSTGALYKLSAFGYSPSANTYPRCARISVWYGGATGWLASKIATNSVEDAWEAISGYFVLTNTVMHFGCTCNSIYADDIAYFDTPSLKQVTDPPSTGVRIITSAGAQNWEYVESGFDANSALTASVWNMTMLSMVDGNAFANISMVDLTPYQNGNHRLVVEDSSGNIAYGIISATAPEGESLGSELVINGGIEDGTPPTAWSEYNSDDVIMSRSDEQANSGTYSAKNIVSVAQAGMYQGNISETAGACYKFTYSVFPVDLTRMLVSLRDGNWSSNIWFSSTTYPPLVANVWNTINIYGTSIVGGITGAIMFRLIDTGTLYVDDVSLKQVTDPPATGARIVDLNGDQNWEYIDASFDPNGFSQEGIATKYKGLMALGLDFK